MGGYINKMDARTECNCHCTSVLFVLPEMAFKIFVLLATIALSRASHGPAAVIAPAPVLAKISDSTFDPNPAYSFAYDVQDALTGDSKGHVESRANGIVSGQYNVAEPDGTRRIVDYTADPINGFNAVVRKTPLAVAAAPIVARAVPAAHLLSRAVAPAPVVAHAAPVVAGAPYARIALG